MGVAGTAACHRVRIASPEVLHRFENGKTGLFQAPSPAPAPPAAPPRQWWRWERKLRMGVATLSACQWPRVASSRAHYSVSGGATGGAQHGFTAPTSSLDRAGDVGRHDLGTTPRLRRTRYVHLAQSHKRGEFDVAWSGSHRARLAHNKYHTRTARSQIVSKASAVVFPRARQPPEGLSRSGTRTP